MSRHPGALRACAIACALVLAPAAADAAVVVYSGVDVSATGPATKPNADAAHAAFAASLGGLSTFTTTFEGAAAGLYPSYDLGGGGAMVATGTQGSGIVIRHGTLCTLKLCGANTTVGGKAFVQLNGSGLVTFSFAQPIQAFGAYFTGMQFPGMQLTFSDGSSHAVAVPGTEGADFVGFTDFGKSISQVTFDAGRDSVGIDDITFALAAPASGPAGVPEPTSWALMIGGFGLAGATLRGRRRTLTAI